MAASREGRLMRGVFVTGTDTGVGKTVVAAALVQHWAADYWKPVQTGLATDEADSITVARLAALPPNRVHKPRFEMQAPLSPEAAGAREGINVQLTDFALPATPRLLVVEGAGGVLVPLGGGALMVDLISHLGLPAVLAARSTLGTINHSLLSLESLRKRSINVLGVIMVGDAPEDQAAENAASIKKHGEVAILGMLPNLPALTPEHLAKATQSWPGKPPNI